MSVEHGTETRYGAPHRCRCDACRAAAAAARRARRAANREAYNAYERARWARRRVQKTAAPLARCDCLTYGHGLSLTVVPRRDCPLHGERRDRYAAELADTREAARMRRP